MAVGELRRKWTAWRGAAWWPAAILILVQTLNGIWYGPQVTFFPVYLEEQLGLEPALIGVLVSGALVAGMIVALFGGTLTGLLGSKWVIVCGLALSAVGALAFLFRPTALVAVLWFAGGAGLALITVGGGSYLTRLSARASLGALASIYMLSFTAGGVIGNPIAGAIIARSGFAAFGLAELAVIGVSALIAVLLMLYLGDRSSVSPSVRSFWAGALPMTRRAKVRLLMGLRCLPTVFYGVLTLLVSLLLNNLTGDKALVAAYGTATLILASAAQLVAGRAADRWGGRGPTLVAYGAVFLAGIGLALTSGTVWGLFLFGVLGVAAAWSLSTLMYVWVADGVPKPEHASAFGLLHAVWSISMIAGSLLGGWLVRASTGLPFLIAGLLNVGAIFLALAYYGRKAAQQPAEA
jgi:MFS transporter, DHA1 family, inner membrane transport protein